MQVLIQELSGVIPDPRHPDLIVHSQLSLLKQRIYGIALGYEDLNDHDKLRSDPALQTAIDRDETLASSATLCRLENRSVKQVAWDIHSVFIEKFIQSFKKAPQELILDFDATDDPVHGEQEGRFFHGYYREYCFLPLYVFCEDQLLVSYLRPSNQVFSEIIYAAESWSKKRRIIVKAEFTSKGDNTRFVVTSLSGDAQHLYDNVYCSRGEMENRIKEQQLDLFADRTSCHRWWANQLRLLFSSAAYILISAIRRVALSRTELARAQCGTIRLKLFKIGAVIIRNTRRIKFLLSSHYPYQDLFIKVAAKLCPG